MKAVRIAGLVALAAAGLAPVRGDAQEEISAAMAIHAGTLRRTQYLAAYTPWRIGPVDLTGLATWLDGRDGDRYGAGLELGILRHGVTRLAVLGGVAGGLARGGPESPWGAWWVGAGYDVVRVGPLALAAEARYTRLSEPDGLLAIGARLRVRLGGRTPSPPRRSDAVGPAPLAVAAGLTPEAESRVLGVVQTATDAMGTPYVWGGTDDNGFDCSGLIQYAYRQHGILIARRSVDQAREGAEVGRDPFALRPGDILTFAATGREVTHVGLYLGEGRFIHSASRGVEVSTLRPTDPVGRYWWERWVGARRIVR